MQNSCQAWHCRLTLAYQSYFSDVFAPQVLTAFRDPSAPSGALRAFCVVYQCDRGIFGYEKAAACLPQNYRWSQLDNSTQSGSMQRVIRLILFRSGVMNDSFAWDMARL